METLLLAPHGRAPASLWSHPPPGPAMITAQSVITAMNVTSGHTHVPRGHIDHEIGTAAQPAAAARGMGRPRDLALAAACGTDEEHAAARQPPTPGTPGQTRSTQAKWHCVGAAVSPTASRGASAETPGTPALVLARDGRVAGRGLNVNVDPLIREGL
jgi:hypothetical protein